MSLKPADSSGLTLVKSFKNRVALWWRMSAVRQAFWLLLVFLILLLIAGSGLAWLIKNNLDQRADTELQLRYQSLKQTIESREQAPGDLLNDGATVKSTLLVNNKRKLTVYGANLEALNQLRAGWHIITLPPDEHYNESTRWRVYVENVAPFRWLEGVQQGHLIMAVSLEANDEFQEWITQALLVIGVIISLLAIFVGLNIGYQHQKRHRSIIVGLDQIAQGDFNTHIAPAIVRDDVDDIAQKIDQTAAQLTVLVAQMKALSANLAHDLKTPLTRLRIHLERALDSSLSVGNGSQSNHLHQVDSNQATADMLQLALNQTDHMLDTFEAILRIARLSSGERRARFQHLSLGTLLEEVHDIYMAVFEEAGRELHLEIDRPAIVQGDRELLIQLLANLLENALRYTPANTAVTLVLNENKLQVLDQGDGIPEDQRLRVLEPMYRLDKSRHTQGSGLGLAMVKAIADLHYSDLMLGENQRNGKGLCVCLVFQKMDLDLKSATAT